MGLESQLFRLASVGFFWPSCWPEGSHMSDPFTAKRTIELLTEGRIVCIGPQADEVVDMIAASMIEIFGRVREVVDDNAAITCLWSIRRGDQCVPFLYFDQLDDHRLWQNFMLFDRHVVENPDFVLPVLLIGTRDVFGNELGGKPNDVLGKKVAHLVAP